MISVFSKEAQEQNEINKNSERVHLYVPYEYKEQAVSSGAKWDRIAKIWFTTKQNENYQKLVDLFHDSNFYDNYYGTHLISFPKTEAQRKEDEEQQRRRYNKLKRKWIKQHGDSKESLYEFGSWYSVVELGHE